MLVCSTIQGQNTNISSLKLSKNNHTVAVSTELNIPLVLDTGSIESLPTRRQQSRIYEFGTYTCTAETQNGEIVETRSIHIAEKSESNVIKDVYFKITLLLQRTGRSLMSFLYNYAATFRLPLLPQEQLQCVSSMYT